MPATPFIGRAEELAEIMDAWAALAGRPGPAAGPLAAPAGPRVVLVTGEAGSGKSRLVAEVLDRLEPRPPVVLAGAARTLGAAPHDWLASVLSGHPVDGGVPPELAQRSPTAGAGTRLAPAAMLRAAVDVVRTLLDGRCGVLVVEDLHDLDPASLTLIGELAATAALPALLLVTSRPPQEAAFAPAAARTLRRLSGAPSVVRAHLAPFDARETAELVEAHRGGTPPPETVRALLNRTGGNPFWLTELVTARGDLAGAPLPAHVAGLLVEPLAGEPALVGRVARAAALLGDPVETDVLVHVCEGEIEPALRRLLDLGMLVIAPDLAPAGPLRFRHPLLREALARSALPSERARVHGLARALAVELGDDAALARHAAALGRLGEASAAAVRGALTSLATGLPDAALELVGLGLRAAGPGAAPTGRELARAGAVAAFVAGRFTVAERHAADWLRQAAGAVETSDAHRLAAEIRWCLADRPGHLTALADARATLAAATGPAGAGPVAGAAAAPDGGTADAYGARNDGTDGTTADACGGTDGTTADDAAGGADGDAGDGGIAAAWARQLAAEAASALRTRAPVEVVPLAEAAMVAAEQSGESIASAGVTLGTALAFGGARDRGVALLHACRQIAEHDRDPVTVGRAVNNLVAVDLPGLGDVTGRRLFDEAMAAIGRSGLEFCAGRTTALGVAHALRTGDLARAETLVWSRLPIETDPVERVRFAATAGLLAVERGDDPLAVRLLARADGEGRDVGLVRVLRVAVAARGVHPVDPALALAECVGRCRPARLVEAARWALHGGVPAATVEDLVGDAVGAAPQLRLLLAVAAGRDAAAVELLPAALRHGDGPAGGDTAGTVEVVEAAPYDAAVHTAAAHALLRLGRAADARQHAERAVALLVHWPGWRLAEAETLLHSLRAGGDLTAREIEVLGCLAAGMSNQQVASSLGISIRTVTVHVSNLLRKTGAASRTEAALWAVRHRVITPT
ncbi:AAA family ATPase [Dactylosporangium aurantiacum]|uniref:AAA family ATPase n=1 Tax=Dactylosporangium aurantiacum TaxID=35754 RepID=A0A9Q9IP01_9ACTN|nr:LuxR C-terminal-related transcriptional regulator [Dactylosporangium aurantiacum]MDG6109213.1 LuxR C-terminal-related transcriptional regulator [Dactylosporangium aurantiacum]UWZ56610.1 AAA family ATPase [Dactylosporangium aurantiacum]